MEVDLKISAQTEKRDNFFQIVSELPSLIDFSGEEADLFPAKCMNSKCNSGKQVELRCPKCDEVGLKSFVVCSQDCLNEAWSEHSVNTPGH